MASLSCPGVLVSESTFETSRSQALWMPVAADLFRAISDSPTCPIGNGNILGPDLESGMSQPSRDARALILTRRISDTTHREGGVMSGHRPGIV